MNTQINTLSKQINETCEASKLDQPSVLAALLASYETIGSTPIDPLSLPAVLPDYDFGGLRIELDRMVATRNDKPLKFTLTEWKILTLLIKSDGKPISKIQLTNLIYSGTDPKSNTVEVFLSHLRAKVGFGVINTLRGIGYVLANKAVLKS